MAVGDVALVTRVLSDGKADDGYESGPGRQAGG